MPPAAASDCERYLSTRFRHLILPVSASTAATAAGLSSTLARRRTRELPVSAISCVPLVPSSSRSVVPVAGSITDSPARWLRVAYNRSRPATIRRGTLGGRPRMEVPRHSSARHFGRGRFQSGTPLNAPRAESVQRSGRRLSVTPGWPSSIT